MPINKSIRFNRIRLALFFPSNTHFKSVSLAASMDNVLGEVFKSEPLIIPDPPGEFPRIVWQHDGVGQCQVGFRRADLVLQWQDSEDWTDELLGIYQSAAQFLLDADIQIVRIGMVIELTLDAASFKSFCNEFIRETKLADAKEVELSWLKVIESDYGLLNRWVRFFLSSEPDSSARVVIDTNTRDEEPKPMSAESIRHMVKEWLDNVGGGIDDVIEWTV